MVGSLRTFCGAAQFSIECHRTIPNESLSLFITICDNKMNHAPVPCAGGCEFDSGLTNTQGL